MRFRKLRFAWSVVCGIACVLLIVLWVRSYSMDEGYNLVNKRLIARSIGWNWGTMYIHRMDLNTAGISARPTNGWKHGKSEANRTVTSFMWHWTSNHLDIRFPFWLIIGVVAALSATPWIRWRFSLRTLLIATTLVAVVLGLIVWAAQ